MCRHPSRRKHSPDPVRLFVAVYPPERERRAWYDAMAPFRDQRWPVRWLPADSLHLTLQFLGKVGDDRVVPIIASIETVAAGHDPFVMRVRGFGAFPSLRRPRVLWLGVESEPQLLALQRDLAVQLDSAGFPPEKRAWSPHITAARVSGDNRRFDGVEDAVRAFRLDAGVEVRSIDLMRSTLLRSGAKYERVAAAVLGER
jgi:RNA 2',3'-cyclic 3'-phosphodiesterase